MKNIKLKLVAELMKNSHRSDRELAKVLKVSQPTVTRTRANLEKEGFIREYTVIPDFARLGFQLAAITLVKARENLTEEELKRAQQIAHKDVEREPQDTIVLLNRGMGGGYDFVFISFHKDYSDYAARLRELKEYFFVNTSDTLSFLINLNDKNQYRNLTFSTLANHLLET